ncbi:MAG TPA: RNA 2',3'-cyclic phosphodiesterase [Methanocorpusculum sp.]|nr:RNA 2',3'-cyclic phosphodiesterase [Methanocorpusculum sp.]
MVRVFIAVEPSAEIRGKVAEVQKALTGVGRLSLVSANLMHITLKFLGEIPESSLDNLKQAVDTLQSSPYTIDVSQVSTFGKPPRVIKAEVHDNNASADLARKLDMVLSPLGYPKDAQKFSPHITIARIKEYSPDLAPKLAQIRDTAFGTSDISELLIKKSVLTPSGPIYTTIHRKSL